MPNDNKQQARSNLMNAFLELEFIKEMFFELWVNSDKNAIAVIHADICDMITPFFQERFIAAKKSYDESVKNPCRPKRLYSVN